MKYVVLLLMEMEIYTGYLEYKNNLPAWGVEYEDPENREEGIWGTTVYLMFDATIGELLKKRIYSYKSISEKL